jgi:GNAT superfamily N-acetyltransferase
VRLRVAEIQDSDAIMAVINAAFRDAESFLIERDRVDRDAMHKFMEDGKFLVADDGGTLGGCVYVELRGERAYLGLLSIDPQRQKSGLGSMLMTEAERYCAAAGCKFVDLRIVSVRRELPSFYRHRGYVETGTTPFTPGLTTKVPCHFVNMSKSLA